MRPSFSAWRDAHRLDAGWRGQSKGDLVRIRDDSTVLNGAIRHTRGDWFARQDSKKLAMPSFF
jgi:Tfp pilus assembly protein PilP